MNLSETEMKVMLRAVCDSREASFVLYASLASNIEQIHVNKVKNTLIFLSGVF